MAMSDLIPPNKLPKWFEPKVTLGNILTLISMLGLIVTGYMNLKLDVASASQRIASIERQVDPIDTLETRMAIVERNQVAGKDAREQAQRANADAIDKLSNQVEQLRSQNTDMLQQLAAIGATLGVPASKSRRP